MTRFRRPVGCVSVAALFSLCACAQIWGFQDLDDSASAAGSGGEGVTGQGTGGLAGETGIGGASGQLGAGGEAGASGGASSNGDAGFTGGAAGAGERAGSGGASSRDGSGGTDGGAGEGGQGGRGGAPDSGYGVDATDGAGAGGQAGGGTVATPDAAVCIPGTNRCVAGDLETCSATGAWQSTGTATRQLLVNASFEQGATGWTVSVAGGFSIVYPDGGNADGTPDIPSQSAPNLTWIGGYNRADDMISQNVVLPANAASMTLSFYYAIVTGETSTAENDVMDVTILAGAQTISVAHFSNLTPVETWTRFSAPLASSLAGQTVTLRFHGTTNANAITSFYIDTVALQVVACP